MKQINNISPTTENAILRKTAYGLPDRPAENGMRASDVKKAFYAGITDRENSILSELKRIVGEANEIIESIENSIKENSMDISKKIDIAQGTKNANKTMVTDAEGNVTPSDVVCVGGITIQKGTTADGEDCVEFVFPGESE